MNNEECPSDELMPFETKEMHDEDVSKNVSIKDAINYAVDVIYELNSRLETPYENPFHVIDDLPKELFLQKFVDRE